ncbi:MAG TPA: trypsin-like peptidase domain-containing protein [Anaerolineae bacterium]|nr:trypsin-like peptidase domain-containing protein [Anaerolineae bacterium]HNU05760.1 trypsin-like peptidase domain-containing protein [Anaerolineae bacterium]
MATQLSKDNFDRLVGALTRLDAFRTATGRVRLVAGALEGSPRALDILGQIDFDGPARAVAVEIVRRFAQFGRVTPDQEALGILVNELLLWQGEADPESQFLRSLFETYGLDRPIAPAPNPTAWKGQETDADLQEKIIGEDTLRPIAMLEQALLTAASVVHISGPQGLGTGFVVGPNLVMTNNHVLASREDASAAEFTFYYELGIDNKVKPVVQVHARKDGQYYTSADLDYSVVQIESTPEAAKPLPLKAIKMARDARVAIIQHPAGLYKKISIQNNFVQYADSRVVQYTTSTLPGSSGSPVLNDDFKVVAIHHSGGNLLEPATARRYLRNEGMSMISVLADLKQNAPEIYERLCA